MDPPLRRARLRATKNWDWGTWGISNNPNITMKWLIQYPDKEWDYSKIKFNEELIFNQKAKEYLAAYRIQQWWYKITLTPEYKMNIR